MKGDPISFGRYLLIDRINVGGMAEVFMAKAFGVEGFERVLAIKRILPNMADDDEFINMFVDEARIAVQLSHANIVQIYELGKFESQYYIAMEYVSGKDLRYIVDGYRKKQQTLPIPAAAYIASKLCEGLDYAHRKTDASGRPLNVIHRDVSPQNILVSFEGAVKITDFGIAKAEDRASKTQAGVLKGKFGYMSPEQVRGLEIDHRSDIFAVGILLYEMLTGKRLFIGESDFSTLEKVRNAEVVPPREHNPEISEELERVMLKALARERDERYAYASDLHDDLQQFLIEDNTIYNAKRVAALLRGDFAADIEEERVRMEEFARVQAPVVADEQALAAAEIHGAADVRAEKTMIFESAALGGDLANAATVVGVGLSVESALSVHEEEPDTNAAPRMAKPRSPRRRTSATRKGPVGVLIVGISLLVAVVGLLYVLVRQPSATSGVGTLVITSVPAEAEIFLDGELVGNRTPITRTNVSIGTHVLRAKAEGYKENASRFELPNRKLSTVAIKLEPLTGSAVIDVTSEPSGASVIVGGVSQGVTPLKLAWADVKKPLGFELNLAGHRRESVTLAPGDTRRSVAVKLSAEEPGAKATKSKLVVRSNPEGARVYSGPNQLGLTPMEIPDLDSAKSYKLRIAKDGFRDYETTVVMGGKSEVVFTASLERKPPPVAPAPSRRQVAQASSGGSSGGGCSGSGAKLSVMARGVADCRVSVGRASLGISPFMGKEAPTGRCEIVVTCPGGKKYSETRLIKAGANERLIIEENMWK